VRKQPGFDRRPNSRAAGIPAAHPFAKNAKEWGTLILYAIQIWDRNGWAT